MLPKKVTPEEDSLKDIKELEELDLLRQNEYEQLLGEVEPECIENLIVAMVKQGIKSDMEYVTDKAMKSATDKAVDMLRKEMEEGRAVDFDRIVEEAYGKLKRKSEAEAEKVRNTQNVSTRKSSPGKKKAPDYFLYGVALILIGGSVFLLVKVVQD